MQLGLGGLTEEVNVTAESPLLETSNASRGTVIDNKRIAELPLQSRNPFALSVLVAGVNTTPGDLPAPIRQRRAGRLVDERRTEPQQ